MDGGSRPEILKNERRRRRVVEKLRRRQKTLDRSATFSAEEKNDIKVGLTIKCMSPEHSAEETNDRESSDSDDDAPAVPKKVLKVRPLSWRSDRFYKTLMSLDRKWLRRTSDKARST